MAVRKTTKTMRNGSRTWAKSNLATCTEICSPSCELSLPCPSVSLAWNSSLELALQFTITPWGSQQQAAEAFPPSASHRWTAQTRSPASKRANVQNGGVASMSIQPPSHSLGPLHLRKEKKWTFEAWFRLHHAALARHFFPTTKKANRKSGTSFKSLASSCLCTREKLCCPALVRRPIGSNAGW